MSHHYDTSTYAADSAGIPRIIDSPERVASLATEAFVQQRASPGKLVYVAGSTRSGWAIYVAKALVDAVNLTSLLFLSDQGHHRFDSEEGFQCISVLQGPSLAAVVSDLKQLLELVRSNPLLAMDADTDGSFIDIEHVTKALSRDYVSSMPAYDYGNVRGDEGQGADYFFTWLRSVLRVAEDALSEGRALVHELRV